MDKFVKALVEFRSKYVGNKPYWMVHRGKNKVWMFKDGVSLADFELKEVEGKQSVEAKFHNENQFSNDHKTLVECLQNC